MSEDGFDRTFTELFPTPVLVARVPDHETLNKELKREIDAVRNATPNGRPEAWSCDVYTTFHSNFSLHHQAGFSRLTSRFMEGATEFAKGLSYPMPENDLSIEVCWLNIYGRNQWQERHNHSSHPIVAIYYAAAPPNCSSLILHSEHADTMLRPQYLGSDQVDHLSIKIDPEPGMMVVFNGHLRHSCTANNIDEERISVSANFNINLKPE